MAEALAGGLAYKKRVPGRGLSRPWVSAAIDAHTPSWRCGVEAAHASLDVGRGQGRHMVSRQLWLLRLASARTLAVAHRQAQRYVKCRAPPVPILRRCSCQRWPGLSTVRARATSEAWRRGVRAQTRQHADSVSARAKAHGAERSESRAPHACAREREAPRACKRASASRQTAASADSVC